MRKWWVPILVVMGVGLSGVLWMISRTYSDAPPIPDFVSGTGETVFSGADILRGQAVFQKYGLMDYGSFFGDGAGRGPDFTADALHQVAGSMVRFYSRRSRDTLPADQDAVVLRVQRELKENRYSLESNTVSLTEGQVQAWREYAEVVPTFFRDGGLEGMIPPGYISDPLELRDLASFFLWGSWICSSCRPGKAYSYTHNWPYDPAAGNTPSAPVLFWSLLGTFGLLLGVGGVLYIHGRQKGSLPGPAEKPPILLTEEAVEREIPSGIERATYPFFAVAGVLFFLQICAGILTVHDFLGLTRFFKLDIAALLPITITRSWHLQLAVFWIVTSWIGASIFFLPRVVPNQPRYQLVLVRLLSWMLLVTVTGTCVGVVLGTKGLAGENWRTLGHQGWEFVELGRLWQTILFAALSLWAVILFRGYLPYIRRQGWRSLPSWLLFAVGFILILFLASFALGPNRNFVISDFWRWMTIHMWVEAFFEVLTTILVAFMLRTMGLTTVEGSRRAVQMSTILFLGSGLLGITHNFYWNAKPVAMLALGSIFSTLQVVPLVRLIVEAWRYRTIPAQAEQKARASGMREARFGQRECYLFLVAVSLWNFFGAGVLGFIINLPIINYYEHGTYLTVNHGHAALAGVYGNLAIAGIIFCCRFLIPASRWNSTLLRVVCWSFNIGLLLTLLMDTFPVGLFQLNTVLEKGYWYARSQAFIQGDVFQRLTWMRIVGGATMTLGGMLPIVWFLLSRWKDLKAPKPEEEDVLESPVAAF